MLVSNSKCVHTLSASYCLHSQGLQKQLQIKQSTYKTVVEVGKQLLSQNTGEDEESFKRKLEDLEQMWSGICQLSDKRQQKLERSQVELSKMVHGS